jgi:hypothetical protein
MKKTLILEQGEYSDYRMYFVRVPEKCGISDKDLLFLLGLDEWSQPSLSGYILGDVIDHEVIDLIPEVEKEINQMFCCYDNRKYKTILDKKHTKEDLLEIATSNDVSGVEYWEGQIKDRYSKYLKAIGLYQKLLNSEK